MIIKPHPHLPIKNIVLDFKIDNKIHINYSPLEKIFHMQNWLYRVDYKRHKEF